MIKELPESLINNSTTNLVEYTHNLQIGNNAHLKPHKIPVGVLPTGRLLVRVNVVSMQHTLVTFLLSKTAIQTVLRNARGAFPFYWECDFIHRHVFLTRDFVA